MKDKNYVGNIKKGPFTLATVFLILGAAFTPLVSFINLYNLFKSGIALIALLGYLVTIPLCVVTILKMKTAERRDQLILWGVLSIFFVSLLGGIFVLVIKESDFRSFLANANEHGNGEARPDLSLYEAPKVEEPGKTSEDEHNYAHFEK